MRMIFLVLLFVCSDLWASKGTLDPWDPRAWIHPEDLIAGDQGVRETLDAFGHANEGESVLPQLINVRAKDREHVALNYLAAQGIDTTGYRTVSRDSLIKRLEEDLHSENETLLEEIPFQQTVLTDEVLDVFLSFKGKPNPFLNFDFLYRKVGCVQEIQQIQGYDGLREQYKALVNEAFLLAKSVPGYWESLRQSQFENFAVDLRLLESEVNSKAGFEELEAAWAKGVTQFFSVLYGRYPHTTLFLSGFFTAGKDGVLAPETQLRILFKKRLVGSRKALRNQIREFRKSVLDLMNTEVPAEELETVFKEIEGFKGKWNELKKANTAGFKFLESRSLDAVSKELGVYKDYFGSQRMDSVLRRVERWKQEQAAQVSVSSASIMQEVEEQMKALNLSKKTPSGNGKKAVAKKAAPKKAASKKAGPSNAGTHTESKKPTPVQPAKKVVNPFEEYEGDWEEAGQKKERKSAPVVQTGVELPKKPAPVSKKAAAAPVAKPAAANEVVIVNKPAAPEKVSGKAWAKPPRAEDLATPAPVAVTTPVQVAAKPAAWGTPLRSEVTEKAAQVQAEAKPVAPISALDSSILAVGSKRIAKNVPVDSLEVMMSRPENPNDFATTFVPRNSVNQVTTGTIDNLRMANAGLFFALDQKQKKLAGAQKELAELKKKVNGAKK